MKFTFVILSFITFIAACGKGHSDQPPVFNSTYQLRSTPDAIANNDGSNFGVYKGVTISALGNSAAIKFDIYNNVNQPYALVYRDNKIVDSLLRYLTTNLGNVALPAKRDMTQIVLNGAFYPAFFSRTRTA